MPFPDCIRKILPKHRHRSSTHSEPARADRRTGGAVRAGGRGQTDGLPDMPSRTHQWLLGQIIPLAPTCRDHTCTLEHTPVRPVRAGLLLCGKPPTPPSLIIYHCRAFAFALLLSSVLRIFFHVLLFFSCPAGTVQRVLLTSHGTMFLLSC